MTDAPERFGPYELISLLGRGGMGDVYRAYDTVRRRTVALKRLPRHLAGDRDYEVRFRREAEVAARLTEPHIIPIHDYGDIDGQLYIDMRLITGADLGDVIGRSGPLPAARAVAVIGQVATALAAAHAEGLVHRDVKPSNVLISTTDRGEDFVHLVDFGIVHEQNSAPLTATGSTIGTLDYMAPERLQQEACDHRVDVYSLGCVLFEALTGSKPFPAGSAAAKMFAHIHTPPPRPAQSRPGIPPGLDDVVAKAMAKNPAERYASTTELATAAYRSLSGTPPQVHGQTRTETRIGPRITGLTGYGAVPTGQGAPPARSPLSATRMSSGPPPQTTRPAPRPTRAGPPVLPPHQPSPGAPSRDGERATRRTLPIVLLAAVVLAAVVALVVLTRPDTSTSTAPTADATSTSTAAQAPASTGEVPTTAGGVTNAPSAGAMSTVIGRDGTQTEVQTSSLELCYGDGVPLTSGQQVPTASVSRIDVTYVGSRDISVTITQTNGQKIDGSVDAGCPVTAQSRVGPFSLDLSRIQSIEINR